MAHAIPPFSEYLPVLNHLLSIPALAFPPRRELDDTQA
jgi:hypothetical protein